MAGNSTLRALILFVVAGLPLSPSSAQKTAMMMNVQSFSTPDFHGKTFQQVQKAAALPNGRKLFAEIRPQGSTDGVVVWQSPQPRTPIVVGKTQLYIALEAHPSIAQQIITALIQPQTNKPVTPVPDLYGMTRSAASAALEKARLNGNFHGVDLGIVALQRPLSGDIVAQGTLVDLTLASPLVVVPNLVGDKLAVAEARLASNALRVGNVFGDGSPDSIVHLQSITPGSEVETNTAVNLTAEAPALTQQGAVQKIAVPYLIGTDIKTAAAILHKVKLSLRLVSRKGAFVVDEIPAPGDLVAPGTIVELSVGPLAPPPPQPPLPPLPPWWVYLIAWARPFLGFGLVIGLLGLGTKLVLGLMEYQEESSGLREIRSRALLPSDVHLVTSRSVPKIEPKVSSGPRVRCALHIRERGSNASVSIKAEPGICRKEKSYVSSN